MSRFVNGCLAGMVSICGGCSHFHPWASCIVASLAGFVYIAVSKIIVKLKIDDPLDAFAVHAGAGITKLLKKAKLEPF